MSAQTSAPSLALLGLEPFRAVGELATTTLRSLRDTALSSLQPPKATVSGDAHPVVVFPGLATDYWATALLRSHLAGQGFNAYDWERGWNTGPQGDLHEWLAPLVANVEQLFAQHGEKVSLVGWSLGGIYAREIAKLTPRKVRRVVTLGSPFAGKPSATNVGWLFQMLNGAPAPGTPSLLRKLRTAPPVACTSVYSRTDGFVGWEGCVQRGEGHYENIEVNTASHLGMVLNGKVLDLVTQALSLPAGRLLTKLH